MEDVRIRRFTDHAHGYQGAVESSDGRWQLCIDADGNPHLFVRVWVVLADGRKVPGLLNTDDLGEERPCDAIDGIAEGEVSEEEADAWHAELVESGRMLCPA